VARNTRKVRKEFQDRTSEEILQQEPKTTQQKRRLEKSSWGVAKETVKREMAGRTVEKPNEDEREIVHTAKKRGD